RWCGPAGACCTAPARSSAARARSRSMRSLQATPMRRRFLPRAICCPRAGRAGTPSRTMPSVSTTASSTPCLKSAGPERDGRRGCLRLLAAAVLLAAGGGHLPAARAQAGPAAEVTQLKLERSDDGIFVSAAVRLDLPPPVLDVLDKGIAIHFVAEAELFRERWYWTDRKIGHAARHMRLAYQPLTRRWRLNVSPVPITAAIAGVTLNQNFDSLDEALDAVRRIGRLRIADASEV